MLEMDQITDSRQLLKVKYSLKNIVGIVFFAVLAGNDEWTEKVDFAVDEKETLEQNLELPYGILSHDTIQMVFEETTYDTITREYFITDDLNWFEDRKD